MVQVFMLSIGRRHSGRPTEWIMNPDDRTGRALAPGAGPHRACVAASVGRCDVCGLERAAWSGGGVRLCEACYWWEVRRGVETGEAAVEG
jgi:hypothetical protein